MYHRQFPMILGRAQRTLERLRRGLFLDSKPLQLRYAVTEQHLSFADKEQLDYQEAPEGGQDFIWGRSGELIWRSAWFCARSELADVLPEWQRRVREQAAEIALDLSLSGEGLVFDRSGRIVQGISGGSVLHNSFERSLLRWADELLEGSELEIWIEAAANTLFGLERGDDPERGAPRYYGEHQGKVHSAQVVLLDKALWHYLIDLESASQLAQNLLRSKAAGVWGADESNAGKQAPPRAKRLIYGIDQSLSLVARNRLSEAHELLLRTFVNGNAPSDLSTVAVGHAHIDTGWLWPVSETVRKCARTFANQLRLMEQYPHYVFGASQAQHYAFVKEHYPELYEQVKERVAEGRWEVQGAMWIEADANIPSGESLLRQVLHGKNFFRDEFGVDVQNLWLPDVFGYSANLPQILRRAGVPYFLTQKLSWSQYNDFPHHTFHWQGVDGSEVLTHFPPEATYNSTLTLGGVHGLGLSAAQDGFKEAHLLDEFMTLYGVGDGGGGPDEAMIERGLRLGASGGGSRGGPPQNDGAENTPRVCFGRADQFFERLQHKAGLLPRWQGELYLELHRGTLTTQARTKYGNRRLEEALHLVEYLYCLSPGIAYPKARIDQLWKTLLINQFHDIIPGSSICEVYQRTEGEYRAALDECQQLRENWQKHATEPDSQGLTLINPYSLPIQLLLGEPGQKDGQTVGLLPAEGEQAAEILGAEGGQLLLRLAPQAIVHVQPNPGTERPLPSAQAVVARCLDDGSYLLENSLVRYRFLPEGPLCEAWDKEAGRSILAGQGSAPAGNRLCLYHDWPRDWDAWDIDINYQAEMLEELRAGEARLLPGTSLCRRLHFVYSCGQASRLEQAVTLEAHSKQLSFAQQVDWRERHCMLRLNFELAVRSQSAGYDIQYAYLQRPTHRNTSWEMAQFEVVGQRYADLSDLDYGVSLLNDSKYGYQIAGNWLDLNLLRSPTLPDPDADLGAQQFRYALLPHCGPLVEAMPQIQAAAARLNGPPLQVLGRLADGQYHLPLRLHSRNVTLEVLKQAEKSEDLIVRLVERAGRSSGARIELQAGFSGLQECDLLEWNDIGKPLPSACELEFTPFAIRTFRLLRA